MKYLYVTTNLRFDNCSSILLNSKATVFFQICMTNVNRELITALFSKHFERNPRTLFCRVGIVLNIK